MKAIKVSEATELQLDWLVASARWGDVAIGTFGPLFGRGIKAPCIKGRSTRFNPSSNWAQGGPIIERHITKIEDYGDCWGAEGVGAPEHFGPTALIAGLRCYVASKLGETAEVPEELV